MGRFHLVSFELLPMLSVDDPATTRFEMLARRHRGCLANDWDQGFSALNLYLQDRKTVVGIVIGNSFDQSAQGFWHGQVAASPFAVDFMPASLPAPNHTNHPLPEIPELIDQSGDGSDVLGAVMFQQLAWPPSIPHQAALLELLTASTRA